MSETLKPCPFCGGPGKLILGSERDGNVNFDVAYVQCFNCRCCTNTFIIDGYYGSTDKVDDAINAWNRRISDG